MMSIRKISILYAACMAVIILAAGCNNDMAVFDELDSNRLKVVFKGSYASNSPAEEWILPANSEDILIKDDSIVLAQEISDETFVVNEDMDVLAVELVYRTGDRVRLITTGTLPPANGGGLAEGTDYYTSHYTRSSTETFTASETTDSLTVGSSYVTGDLVRLFNN